MTSNALKKIKEFASEGRFKDLQAALAKSEVDIDTRTFLEVLRGCSVFCNKTSDKKSINYKELFEVLKLKVPLVNNLPGANLYTYLNYLYHCLPVPISEDIFDDVQTLHALLLPRCAASTSCKIYRNIVKMLHNAFHASPSLTASLPEIVSLMFKLCKATQDSDLMLVITSNLFTKTFNSKVHDVECLTECYYSFIDSSKGMDFEESKLVESLGVILTQIMVVYVQGHHFSKLKIFMDNLKDNFEFEKYQHLWNVLNFIVLLSPSKLDRRSSVLNVSVNSLQKVELKAWVIAEFFAMIGVILNYYKVTTEYVFPTELHSKFLTFLLGLMRFVNSGNDTGKCPCGCTVKKNVARSVIYFKTIVLLIDLSLDSSPDHATYLNVLSKYSTEISYLKESNCIYMAHEWNSFGRSLFAFGERSNNMKYFEILIKNYLKFQSGQTKITSSDVVDHVILSFRRYVSEDPKSILSFCALAIYLVPIHRQIFLPLWLTTKYNHRDVWSELTMVRAIYLLDWNKFDINLALTIEDQIDLLVYELESYKKSWKSKQAMMVAFKELHLTADSSQAAEMAVRIFGDRDMAVHGEVGKIITDIVKDYKTNAVGIEQKLYLSKLYFMVYKFRHMESGRKTCVEVEKNMSIKPMKSEEEMVTDPEDECDVVSSYAALRLDKCVEEWKYLDQSLELLIALAKKIDLSKYPDLNLYDLLMKIAFEYQMHCHYFKTLQALELALQIALAEDDPHNVIHTVSYLLPLSPSSLTLAEKFLPRLDPTNAKTLLLYYINKAWVHLRDNDVERSVESFKLASDLFKQEEIEQRDFIKCRLVLLEMKYLDLACDTCEEISQIVHGRKVLTRGRKAYEMAIGCMKAGPLDTESLLLVLDLVEGLVSFYLRMKEPRAIRFYASTILLVAQKMVLPSRCATLLAHLAFADIQTGRYEDCYVKLSGLSDILALPKRWSRPASVEEAAGLVEGMKRLSLEVGDIPRRCLNESPTREYLSVERMEMPSFYQHGKSCECFYCVCLEYQVWVLMAIRLDLVYNQRENCKAVLSGLRCNADTLYDRYLRNYRHHSLSPLKTIYEYINTKLMISYYYVLLDHTRFLYSIGDRSMAIDTLDKLSEMVVKTDCPQLIAETFEMRIVLKYDSVLPNLLNIPYPQDGADFTDERPCTPIGNKQLAPPPLMTVTFSSPEPLRPIRVPKLIFSPDDKVPNTPKLRVPDRRTKTPKPEKVQVETPKPDEIEEYFKTPKPNRVQKDCVKPEGIQEEPGTRSAKRRGRPPNGEPGSSTRSMARSKLLVEKLKSGKTEQEEPKPEEVTNSCRKLRPRKNLMF